MEVTLKSNTDLDICSDAIRECYDTGHLRDTVRKGGMVEFDDGNCLPSHEKVIGSADMNLIDRIGNQNKHGSTLEHLVYTFQISGVSRALLQELARHRIASYSVKSSRYTLQELKNERPFIDYRQSEEIIHEGRAEKFIVFTSDKDVNLCSIRALDNLREIIQAGVKRDVAKFCMPESYKTSLTWTINARSLQNFLSLRSSPRALWEIQELSKKVFESLPKDHKYLFENNMLNLEEQSDNVHV